MEDLGVRVGYVYKKDNNGWQQFNVARPFEAFNVPVTRPDPVRTTSSATATTARP